MFIGGAQDPVLTLSPPSIMDGWLLDHRGTVIVEVIFAWPGLSTLLFQGIQTHDFPVVQGCVLVVSSLFVVITLLVDVINGMLDPRVAQGEHA